MLNKETHTDTYNKNTFKRSSSPMSEYVTNLTKQTDNDT